jgi:Fe(3+) dicitrate transport protein
MKNSTFWILTVALASIQTAATGQTTADSLSPQQLRSVEIRAQAQNQTRLRAVEGLAIYEGKKSEVVQLSSLTANLSTNNARQVFAKVAGLNIWESDGGGLQLGVGGLRHQCGCAGLPRKLLHPAVGVPGTY